MNRFFVLLVSVLLLTGCAKTNFSLDNYSVTDVTNFKREGFCIIDLENNSIDIQRVLINSNLGNLPLQEKYDIFKDEDFIKELYSDPNKIVFVKYAYKNKQEVDIISLIYSNLYRYQVVTGMTVSAYNTNSKSLLDSLHYKLTPEELDRYFTKKCD
jgi:hypothetical protein